MGRAAARWQIMLNIVEVGSQIKINDVGVL
jgi:hypothetical protein